MLKEWLSIFETRAFHRITMLFNITSQIMTAFEDEFKSDKNGKNVAIDKLIEFLQHHKDPEPSKEITTKIEKL